MGRVQQAQIAVFARNHRVHLDEAVALCAAQPARRVTFRAAVTWASAERAAGSGEPIPIYLAAIGGNGAVEYVADLHEVQTHPHYGDRKTERLLGMDTPSTKGEGLWEKFGKTVRTLYSVGRCRKLQTPFPLSDLLKASNGSPISADFKYSYALVQPADEQKR